MRDYKGEEQDADNPSYHRRTAIDPFDPAPNAPGYRGYIRTAATLGPPIPLVWGTERVTLMAIYAHRSDQTEESWNPEDWYWIRGEDPVLNGVYTLQRLKAADTAAVVMAICEAPISAVRGAP